MQNLIMLMITLSIGIGELKSNSLNTNDYIQNQIDLWNEIMVSRIQDNTGTPDFNLTFLYSFRNQGMNRLIKINSSKAQLIGLAVHTTGQNMNAKRLFIATLPTNSTNVRRRKEYYTESVES